ncbi:MAG: hypothetical protein LBI58_00170 [Tannerellaceae bacterium]|jgi:hypothetical protein|nr:hypothetical protein [Tannerellaceae bacterium]
MSANIARVQSVIENTLASAVEKLIAEGSGGPVSDLHIQADAESGEVLVFGEDETVLERIVIFDWVNSEEDSFHDKITPVLKASLASLNAGKLFDHASFVRPFSVNLVDENFAVSEELLFVDEDTFRLDDPLLKDLDDELDAFLKDLLSDLPK